MDGLFSSIPGIINSLVSSNSDQQNNQQGQNGSNPPNYSIEPVKQFLLNKGIALSAKDEADLNQAIANRSNKAQLDTQYQALVQGTGVGNSAANAQAQRNLITNAQRYDAENTANQLNNLSQSRNTTMQGISNAFNTAASMFR